MQWSVPDKKLVKWRVPVNGLGHSSPIVWGDHVCTASAISGTPDPQLKVGLYGDIGSVLDHHRAQMDRRLLRQEDRQAAVGARREDRRADRQAASRSPRTPARRSPPTAAHRRDVRVRRACYAYT